MSGKMEKRDIKKGGKIVFAICIAIIVVLLALVIYLLSNRKLIQEAEPVNRNVVVNAENAEEVLAELDEKEAVPVGYYETIMNSTWNFPSGDEASSNAYVENAVANTNPVYFDVTLADTDETIYASPILPVGSHIENITLDSKLSAGTYDCIVTYHLLDEENRSISTLKLTLTIIIEK